MVGIGEVEKQPSNHGRIYIECDLLGYATN